MDSKALVVVKSNKVVEASYKLSLAEQRVLLACIAQIHSKKALLEGSRFEITAANVADIAELKDIPNAYKILKLAAEKLSERWIIINDPDPDNPKTTVRKTRWISTIDYQPGEGKVVLYFSFGIIPYLSQLTREFTQYKLKNVTRFESVYSIRLYELLAQWLSTGKRDIEVEWLKKQFQVEHNYPRITDFKKWVIDVAKKEINEHSNIWVKYSQRKAGRTITHFCFEFGLKEAEKTTQKKTANGTKQLVPDWNGHPTYEVDSKAVLADHKRLKAKPEAKPKNTLDDSKKQKIAALKMAAKSNIQVNP